MTLTKKLLRGVAIFVLALAVYWGTALVFGAAGTPDTAYFNHLADAFLHGQLYLAQPPNTHDLTQFAGRWYVPFPPLPALLMLPWVALAGLSNVQTVLFCAIFGALNVTFVYGLLQALSQRGWTKLSVTDNLWLTGLFGLGSVHWYMATIGSVWFVAQICTVTFVALAVWSAVANGSPWLAGLALGLAMVGRPNVALTWPLLLGIAALQLRTKEGRIAWPALTRWAIASAIPMLLAVAGLLLYNNARFGNPLDFGYLSENVADRLKEPLRVYGQFNLHYAAKNFWSMWLAGPKWEPKTNFWLPDPEGMSLFMTTPALLYLGRARRVSPLTLGGWIAFVLLMIPLLLYYNTGWYQFGYRFSLDFMVPVMILFAIAAGTRMTGSMRALILVGVLVNLYGVLWWHLR
ncbi:MAG: hypothetical protein U0350_45340 [Caldilineaceae bacterium]